MIPWPFRRRASPLTKQARWAASRTRPKNRRRDQSETDDDVTCADDGSDVEEEEPSLSASATLTKVAKAQGMPKKTRLRTVTNSVDATLRAELSADCRRRLLHRMQQDANALGVQRHLSSVHLANLADVNPGNRNIFDWTFSQQLFTRLFSQSHHHSTVAIDDPHFEAFLIAHPLSTEVTEIVREFPKRPRDAICAEMMDAIDLAILGNLQLRATSHIACALKRALWEFRELVEDVSVFIHNLQRLASVVSYACTLGNATDAPQSVIGFCDRQRGHAGH